MHATKRQFEGSSNQNGNVSAPKRRRGAYGPATATQDAETTVLPSIEGVPRTRRTPRTVDIGKKTANTITHRCGNVKKNTRNHRQEALPTTNIAQTRVHKAGEYDDDDHLAMGEARLPDTSIQSGSLSIQEVSIFSRPGGGDFLAASRASSQSSQTVQLHVSHEANPALIRAPVDPSINRSLPVCVSFTKPTMAWSSHQEGKIKWEWRGDTQSYKPEWAFSVKNLPVIDIKTAIHPYVHLAGINQNNFEVTYLPKGNWNGAWKVWSTDSTGVTHEAILKVPKPIMPWYKTQSEIVAMAFVRERSHNVPVPKVFAFDSSMDNTLGLEWISMEMAHGHEYADIEHDLKTKEEQDRVYELVADWHHELRSLRFSKIGSLYREWDPSKDNYLEYFLGPSIDQGLLRSDRGRDLGIICGPYFSISQYFHSLLHGRMADVANVHTKKTIKQRKRLKMKKRIAKVRKKQSHLEEDRWKAAPSVDGRLKKVKQRFHGLVYNVDHMSTEIRKAELESLVLYSPKLPENIKSVADHVRKEIALEEEKSALFEFRDKKRDNIGEVIQEEHRYHSRMSQRLQKLIPLICGEEHLTEDSTCLPHWDISDRNVILDKEHDK